MNGLSAGLDIGGTKTLAVVIDDDGADIAQTTVPTGRGGDEVVRGAVRAVGEALRAAGAGTEDLSGVGIGVPGIIDRRCGTVRHAVNVGIGDTPFPLAARASQGLGGVPVAVDNDLNVAALGAARLAGATGGPVDLAYLALGTGVAAGIVLDGRLRRGCAGVAGEIGHVVLDARGPKCGCGRRGCLEVYASGTALAAAWPVGPTRYACAELAAAARAGDRDALAVWHRFTAAVAAGVQVLALTVDVGRVVLGGGVAKVGQPLLGGVREALVAAASTSPFVASLRLEDRVSLAPQDRPIAAIGAGLLAQADRARLAAA